MPSKTQWVNRERKLESGKVIRYRERDLGNGEVERIYEDELQRASQAQAVSVRAA